MTTELIERLTRIRAVARLKELRGPASDADIRWAVESIIEVASLTPPKGRGIMTRKETPNTEADHG